jgi:hypothetical protein
VTVCQHGRGRGFARGIPVTPVIDGQEIDTEPIVKRPEIVIIVNDFTVTVEKQDIHSGFSGEVKTCPYRHLFRHRDQDITSRSTGTRSVTGSGMKEKSQDVRIIEKRIINSCGLRHESLHQLF